MAEPSGWIDALDRHAEWVLASIAAALLAFWRFAHKVSRMEQTLEKFDDTIKTVAENKERLTKLETQFTSFLERDKERYEQGQQRGLKIDEAIKRVENNVFAIALAATGVQPKLLPPAE